MANRLEKSESYELAGSSENEVLIKALLKKENKNQRDFIKKYVDQQIKPITLEIEKSIKNDIEDSKSKSIEILAIFVALFTFVSIEFQIFKSFTSWEAAAGLTFIVLGSLSFFAILTSHLISKRSLLFFLLYIIPLIFCFLGMFYFQGAKIVDSNYIQINEDLKNTIINEKKNTEILKCLENVGYFKKDCLNKN